MIAGAVLLYPVQAPLIPGEHIAIKAALRLGAVGVGQHNGCTGAPVACSKQECERVARDNAAVQNMQCVNPWATGMAQTMPAQKPQQPAWKNGNRAWTRLCSPGSGPSAWEFAQCLPWSPMIIQQGTGPDTSVTEFREPSSVGAGQLNVCLAAAQGRNKCDRNHGP